MSIKDRLKRRKWFKERLHWQVEDWAKVIFSDESNFEVINRKSQVIVKRLSTEKYLAKFCLPRVQGGGGSAGIWGCITHQGTGIHNIYSGRVNQYVYKEILENCLVPTIDLYFEQDGNWQFMQDDASTFGSSLVERVWV